MENQLAIKVIDLFLLNSIKENKFYIEFYSKQINLYQKLLDSTKNNEPPKFLKAKHFEWETTVNDYILKINEYRLKIEKEIDAIHNIQKNISSSQTNIS